MSTLMMLLQEVANTAVAKAGAGIGAGASVADHAIDGLLSFFGA